MVDDKSNDSASADKASTEEESSVNEFDVVSELDVKVRLNLETGIIAWKDLVPHFARGVVIKVLEGRDLVQVGDAMAQDNTALLQQWLQDESVSRASDDDARDWTAREPDFWCVVTAPWVLVQEYSEKSTVH